MTLIYGLKNPFDTPERKAFRETLETFVAAEIRPHAFDWDVAGHMPVAEICKAKFHATKALEFCASETIQILGGAGYLRGNRIETVYREFKVMAIGGGSEEIMRDLAVR